MDVHAHEFHLLPVAAALHGDHFATDLISSYGAALAAPRTHLVASAEAAPVSSPLVVLVATGGSERQVLAAWRARQVLVPGEPLLLLTNAEHNSLPAALEALARIRQDGGRGRIVMLEPGEAPTSLDEAVADLSVWHALRRARVGLVGTPSDWLVASVPQADGLRRRWGVSLIDVDMRAVLERFDENIAAPIAVPVTLRARPHSRAPHPAEVETAGRFEPVLREVICEQRLSAVAVRCFDLVTDAHTSGCVALAALNDSDTVAGCEGDVASTVAMLWLRLLVGRRGWMANPARVDAATGTVELAHCTVPFSMVEEYHLDTHFESGLGVGVVGRMEAGPVTLVRLGGGELEQLWCVDGESIETEPREGRCRTQVDVHIPSDAARELLERPLGNHLVLVQGHHAERLRAWWSEMVA